MISAQSHLLQLSGSKWLIYIGLALVVGACSPKLQPVAQAPKPVEKPVVKAPEVKPVKVEPRFSLVSLILPFDLDYLKDGYSNTALKEANIAVEYYQGFKLALDSLTASGYNYRLQVYDSKSQPSQSHALAYNEKIRASDLIVGPVFPHNLKAFTDVLTSARKPILSPLASASPATFKNQNLITAITPLEYHVWAAAKYITTDISAKKVFVLRSGFSEENEYLTPFKKAIDSLGKKRIKINQLTVVRGNLKTIIPQLSLTEQNIFVIPASNQAFLTVTLRTLDSLSNKFPITVFGHPNWEGYTFLKADLLQRLNTHITSSQNTNYKDPNTITFISAYRWAYRTEPTEYAIKGFDEGLYFGKLLGENKDGFKNLGQNEYTGLHNSFMFIKKPGLGWINTHVNVLKYSNFALKQVK
jgi:ABC-type branched-subunit amino acid transport system substrate-binding protein